PRLQNPWPGWPAIHDLLPGAFALATLGLIETIAIGKTIASKTGGRIDPNQEALAQGFTNFASSFLQCIPGSGSFTRSALDQGAGGATRFAAVYNAIFVAIVFLALGGLVEFVPLASLAAVLFVIGYQLIDWRYLMRIARTNWVDTTVCLITFAATLVAPLEWAVFIGIGVNLALYLRSAARLHMNEMVPTAAGPFFERPIHDRSGEKQVIFLQLEGELFFGVADELQTQLSSLSRSGVRIAILRLKRTHSIDATVLHVLEEFARDMHRRHGYVILCGVREELMATLHAYGLIKVLGRQNVFAASIGVFSSAKRALERAKELVGKSIDDSKIDTDESKEFDYQI
ncbi:MAG TPA: SulP family inorganic anion transporter, partial [Tepidisphaeraceae bacterium]|nr:SulP family inorganic anion transporter [Tepidisphaeraceae bacterium]